MRHARKLWTVLLAVCGVGVLAVASSPLVAAASPGLDDEASQFELFFDCHPTVPNCPGQGSATNVGSPSLDGQSLRISFVPGTLERAKWGSYVDWNCINSFIGAKVADRSQDGYLEVQFRRGYKTEVISKVYEQLPG